MNTSKNTHNDCSVAKTLKIMGSKWTALLIHNIFEGQIRFGQLERSMPGISPKTLTQRLRDLEKEGIINKKVFKEVPLHVEYNLTKKGKSLEEIFIKMTEWGESH